ncbi:MAG: DUF3810 family protein, partial [Bacteroidota bacterium]
MKLELRKKWLDLLIPFLISCFITIFSQNPEWVEDRYSKNFYPILSKIQRSISGIFPFSVGDILYTSVALFLLWRLCSLLLKFIKEEKKKPFLQSVFLKIIATFLWVYAVFYLFWGLNYDRLGITSVFKLPEESVDQKEIIMLTNELKDSINKCAQLKSSTQTINHNLTAYRSSAIHSYKKLERHFPEFIYENPSFKSSLFGEAANYMGIQGYYNPFT